MTLSIFFHPYKIAVSLSIPLKIVAIGKKIELTTKITEKNIPYKDWKTTSNFFFSINEVKGINNINPIIDQ